MEQRKNVSEVSDALLKSQQAIRYQPHVLPSFPSPVPTTLSFQASGSNGRNPQPFGKEDPMWKGPDSHQIPNPACASSGSGSQCPNISQLTHQSVEMRGDF